MTAPDKDAGISILLVPPFVSPEPRRGGFPPYAGPSPQCVGSRREPSDTQIKLLFLGGPVESL